MERTLLEETVNRSNDEILASQLAARAAQVDATVAYSILPLDGGAAIGAHGDARLPTASTFKVYLLAALYAADAAGRLSLDERVEYRPEDSTRGSGVLKLLAPGLQPTLRDHARLMIVISDNVSTNVVMRALGPLLGKYRPTPVEAVATAMIAVAKEPEPGARAVEADVIWSMRR